MSHLQPLYILVGAASPTLNSTVHHFVQLNDKRLLPLLLKLNDKRLLINMRNRKLEGGMVQLGIV
jgi:hypothetical protein